jgi:hypothetical protein
MLQTVIGIFENSYVAQKASEALIENGFDNGSIEINDHIDTVDELVTDGQMVDTTEKNEYPSYYSDATNASMVTVHVNYTGETLLAADILGEYGAVDINEFSEPANK